MTHCQAERDVSLYVEHVGRLHFIKHEDRTVGQWAEARWNTLAIYHLVQQLDLHPAMELRYENATFHCCCHDDWRIATDAIWLGEWTFHDYTQIEAMIRQAAETHQRLRWYRLDAVTRQQYRQAVIFTGWCIETRSHHPPVILSGLTPRTADALSIGINALVYIGWQRREAVICVRLICPYSLIGRLKIREVHLSRLLACVIVTVVHSFTPLCVSVVRLRTETAHRRERRPYARRG